MQELCDRPQLKRLGEYYAKAIHSTYGDDFDVLFGPAYKGIPLGVVTAIAYSELYGKEVRYCSDRKEAKDHGADKGNFPEGIKRFFHAWDHDRRCWQHL